MTELSPSAQAVLNAFNQEKGWLFPSEIIGSKIAAALRAVTDQVLPLRLIDEPEFSPGTCCERVLKEERAEVRSDLLAIAAELEGSL